LGVFQPISEYNFITNAYLWHAPSLKSTDPLFPQSLEQKSHNPWNKFPTILGISNKRYYYLPINQYDIKNGINCCWRLRLPTRRRHLDCSNRLPKTLAATTLHSQLALVAGDYGGDGGSVGE
jgi:hypothetical protein